MHGNDRRAALIMQALLGPTVEGSTFEVNLSDVAVGSDHDQEVDVRLNIARDYGNVNG